MSDKQIAALAKAAAKKKQEALAKTEKAIKNLIEKQHKITIRSVAREAGVSVSYIYKYPELSLRIQQLKNQQRTLPAKVRSPSTTSQQTITTQLRNRIKILEEEKEELKNQITILNSNVEEMGNSENTTNRLKAENIRLLEENSNLRRQLENTEKKLYASREFILSQGYQSHNIARGKSAKKVIQPIPEE